MQKEIYKGNLMATFKVQTKAYHLIEGRLPTENKNSQFLQVYFISDGDQ